MKKKLLFLLLLFFSIFQSYAQIRITDLKCEYLSNPIGIDELYPRFTWQIRSEERGILQKKYQLVVGTTEKEVASGRGNIWDSDTIKSSTIPVVYQGPSIQPFTRYFWSVRLQDESNRWSEWASPAYFETGVIKQENWKGQWITDTYDYNIKPAPYFRKEFTISKTISSARVYIAVAGLYELFINGKRIGDHRLDPMYTRFDRRTLYVTYDVTENLQQGENVVGILLGNGWYNLQSTAVWYFDKAPWRAHPKFCMDLRMIYMDGSVETIFTGQDWQTHLSPVTFNSIYTGEHYDGQLEQQGWDMPGFNSKGWENAMSTGAPSQNITAQALHPIRNITKISTIGLKKLDEHTWLFDFGRNIAGVTQIKVSGQKGTNIRLKHAEKLDSTGYADISNIAEHYRPTDDSDPFQTDIFILKGQGEETFMPRFNYKGFQYVEVTSDRPIELTQESLTAYFMHSDVPQIGKIHSSNTTLNKIWEAANASYFSNLFGYPTDCPHREKNGWTGDAHIAVETGLYNFDGITIYEKWLADHRDEQQPNGVLPSIIPSSGWGYQWGNGPDWTSTIAIIPWNIYLFYGDSRLLGRCYDNIKRYVDYIDEHYPSGIVDWGLGDWVPVKSIAPKEFTSTAYYYVDALILSKAAKLFNKQIDEKKYSELGTKIKKAFNEKYLNHITGIYGSGLQTEQSVPLHWNLAPNDLKEKVAENLANRVIADGKHIDVGLLGSKTILNALSENGYADLAYEVASQETFPSWGWWIINGATTFYENWPIEAARNVSMNHIMFGEIDAWYYKALGGIFPDENLSGFKNIILKPNFVQNLNHFEAMHEGPYGKIVSSWEKKGKKVEYNISIPANSIATLYLNGNKITENGKSIKKNPFIKIKEIQKNQIMMELKSGDYHFEIR